MKAKLILAALFGAVALSVSAGIPSDYEFYHLIDRHYTLPTVYEDTFEFYTPSISDNGEEMRHLKESAKEVIIDADNPDSYIYSAFSCILCNEYDAAIKMAEKGLALKGATPQQHSSLYEASAVALYHKGNRAKAIKTIDKAIKATPERPMLRFVRALFNAKSDPKAALADLNVAKTLDESDQNYWLAASIIYENQGDIKAAIAELDAGPLDIAYTRPFRRAAKMKFDAGMRPDWLSDVFFLFYGSSDWDLLKEYIKYEELTVEERSIITDFLREKTTENEIYRDYLLYSYFEWKEFDKIIDYSDKMTDVGLSLNYSTILARIYSLLYKEDFEKALTETNAALEAYPNDNTLLAFKDIAINKDTDKTKLM